MNYSHIYTQLIDRGIQRQANLSRKEIIEKFGYMERHHIIPKSMGGSESSSNLVYLTPEEHYLAHGLLVKIYPTEIKLLKALMILSGTGKKNRNNKLYGWARRKYSEMKKGSVPTNKGKKGPIPWNKGLSMPIEVCRKLSDKKKRAVSIHGIIYESISKAAECLNIENYNRISNRCKSDKYPEWFFLEEPLTRNNKSGIKKSPMSEDSKNKMRKSISENHLPK